MKGSVRKRGSTWTAYWSFNDPGTGTRRQDSKGGFPTKREAQAHLNDVLAKVAKGAWKPRTKLTVKEFVNDTWLPGLKNAVAGGKIKPATESFYSHLANRHILPRLGAVKLGELSAVGLNAFYAELLSTGRLDGESGLSKSTVARVHVTIHRMLRDAVKWGELERNVSTDADAPRSSPPQMDPWSPSDTRKFIEATSATRLGALWRLLAMTGLRRGEVCGLQWSDIDLDERRMRIERARVMAAGKIVISTPKTDDSARSIGLDPGTAMALRSFKALQSTERLAAGEAWASPVDWVFTDEIGRPLHPTKVSKLFTEALDKAKMRKVRLHDLRHGYATAALEAGAPLKVVSERLGHKNIGITADLYSHVRPEVDQALADQVAGLIMNAETS